MKSAPDLHKKSFEMLYTESDLTFLLDLCKSSAIDLQSPDVKNK